MADTPRTLAALQALLADNTSAAISPQDIRDMLVSVFPQTTKGDLPGIDATGIIGRLPATTDGFVLTLDTTQTYGFKWAAAGAGSHPDLATHDALGLATDAELATHAAAADPHAGYVLESLLDAKGDLITASADNTPAKLTVGADDTILMADAAAGGGLKWVASASPSPVGTAAVVGTADTFTRGDHIHAHEAAHVAHDTLWDAAGDLVVGTGADTAAKLAITVPAANILEVLGVVNGETTATWKAVHDATVPSTQAFGDAASAGTALTASHRDHKHGMPAANTGGPLIHDEVAASLTARTDMHFMGKGVLAQDNASRTEIIIPTLYDCVVDSADTNAVGKGTCYSTLQAAITAGHSSIWVRSMADVADIVIGTAAGGSTSGNDDAVTAIYGMNVQTVTCPVNVKSNKDFMLFQYLNFSSKYLWFNAQRNITFGCLYGGTLTPSTALINSAAGIDRVATSIAFDGGTGGGLPAGGYAIIENEVIGYASGGDPTAGTLTLADKKNRGINETLAEMHLDNVTITSLVSGYLRVSAADCKAIECIWAACTTPTAHCVLVEPLAHRFRLVTPTFLSNTCYSLVAGMPYDTVTTTMVNCAVSGGGGSGNTTVGPLFCMFPNTEFALARPIKGWGINGMIWATFDAGFARIFGGSWDITGNVFDGTPTINGGANNLTLTFRRLGGGGGYTGTKPISTGDEFGTATSIPTATTLADTTKSWTVNGFTNYIVETEGKRGRIISNTATVLTIVWWQGGNPATATTYRIHADEYLGVTVAGSTGTLGPTGVVEMTNGEWIAYGRYDSTNSSGTSTAVVAGGGGVAPTMTNSGAAWTTDQWKGHLVETDLSSAIVVSNTATVLTLDYWLGGTPAVNTYIIRPCLKACVRGLSGTTAASIAANDTAAAISQHLIRQVPGDTNQSNFVTLLADNEILNCRVPTLPIDGDSANCAGCYIGLKTNPVNLTTNIMTNVPKWYGSAGDIWGANQVTGQTPALNLRSKGTQQVFAQASQSQPTFSNVGTDTKFLGFGQIETEVDFGSTPVNVATFTISDTKIIAVSNVIAAQSGKAATGRQADENEMDAIMFNATPAAGSFVLNAQPRSGPVVGKYKVNYTV
jgi:hypothetical protein